MRAGLFGGTFNPIHNGHLMVATQVVRHFALDRLFIIPCREPPHKRPSFLARADDRVRMIDLALPADDRIVLSDIELSRNGPSYTIDTVRQFHTRIVPDAELFLVMGLDAFLELHTWRSYARLIEIVQPLVVFRPEDDGSHPDRAEDRMDAYIRGHLPDGYRFEAQPQRWCHRSLATIHLLRTTPLAISSSLIRRRIRQGGTITGLVPPAVTAYIEQKELYR
jgi:nicotinate-nucleotide adenylyltransferase